MFFEVCIISFGLFSCSELYKKIKLKFQNEPRQPSSKKKYDDKKVQNEPLDRISIRVQEKVGEITNVSCVNENHTDIRTALGNLTTEVHLLRKEIVKFQKANTKITAKVIEHFGNDPSENARYPDKSSIFKQIIKDNIELRET